jgi:hypothetical protein
VYMGGSDELIHPCASARSTTKAPTVNVLTKICIFPTYANTSSDRNHAQSSEKAIHPRVLSSRSGPADHRAWHTSHGLGGVDSMHNIPLRQRRRPSRLRRGRGPSEGCVRLSPGFTW